MMSMRLVISVILLRLVRLVRILKLVRFEVRQIFGDKKVTDAKKVNEFEGIGGITNIFEAV